MRKPPDLTGRKFGRLTVLRFWDYSELYNGRMSSKWLCLCECGNEKVVNRRELQNGDARSCGCLRKEKTVESFKLVEGTSLVHLSEKLSSNNRSGHKGVAWNKQTHMWEAYIHFQHKKIYLGRYAQLPEAIKARVRAEEKYYIPILERYESKPINK